MKRYTMANIRAANKEAGLFFFGKETMDHCQSKIESDPYHGEGGVFFITSEVNGNHPRAYTVRQFFPETGAIRTVGPYNRLTKLEARELARMKARGV